MQQFFFQIIQLNIYTLGRKEKQRSQLHIINALVF